MKAEDVPFAPTKIIVDTYEPDDVWGQLVKWRLSPPVRYPLPFGDYWVRRRDGELVAIERKHNDLAQEWPRRLKYQLDKCRDRASVVVLLVEGIMKTEWQTGKLMAGRKVREVWYDQVWSTLLGWQENRQLRVYQCDEGGLNVARAVRAIFRHYRRASAPFYVEDEHVEKGLQAVINMSEEASK